MALDFDVAVMLRGLHEEQRQRDLMQSQIQDGTAIDAETLGEGMIF